MFLPANSGRTEGRRQEGADTGIAVSLKTATAAASDRSFDNDKKGEAPWAGDQAEGAMGEQMRMPAGMQGY
jgi:hypothetical protein